MKLANVVWFLWGWRILTVNILLYPVADHFNDNFQGTYLLLLFVDSVLIIMLGIKYKSTQINLEGNRLTLTKGFILHRKVCINLGRTCALSKISTPLCRKLRLYYLIIYCEGARFILPPLENNVASSIEKECKKR